MALDLSRFERISGPARHYIDRQTGEEITYRQALNRSLGTPGAPERKAAERRGLGLGKAARRFGALERRWHDKIGTETRGPGRDESFDQMLAELRDVGSLGGKGQRDWYPIIDDYGLTGDNDDDFLDDFFDTD